MLGAPRHPSDADRRSTSMSAVDAQLFCSVAGSSNKSSDDDAETARDDDDDDDDDEDFVRVDDVCSLSSL